MRRKKGLTIDPNDICYEEPCEEIDFEDPSKIKGTLVEGFSFTEDVVTFAPKATTVSLIETNKPNINLPNAKESKSTSTHKTSSNTNHFKSTERNTTSSGAFDMRRLSLVNGLTPPIDGEKLEHKRSYVLRFSTLKKLEQMKAMHPDIVYVSSIVDMAINYYFDSLENLK